MNMKKCDNCWNKTAKFITLAGNVCCPKCSDELIIKEGMNRG